MTDFAGAQAAETWRYRPFFHAMLDAGVYLPPSAFEAWFVTAAHDDAAIDRIAAALPAAARAGRGGGGGMTIVHLLRHGEVYNPDRVLYGRLPGFRLSDRGVEQAEIAAEFLAARDIGYLVSSPLERARQTAAPLAALTGLDVATDERLIEAANQLEGRQVAGGRGAAAATSQLEVLLQPVPPVLG